MGYHESHDAGIERELKQDSCGTAGCITDSVNISSQVAVKEYTQEQEYHVYDVKAEIKALCCEVIDYVCKSEN